MKPIFKNALIHAVATTIYVVAVASFLFYAPQVLSQAKTVLIPISMLLLLVFSAAFTGILIFGRPVLWYLDGKKKEALSLLAYTLGIFLVITLVAFFILILISYLAR